MIYLFQLMMIAYGATAAWMQSVVVKTFIDYVPIGAKVEKSFHLAGALMTIIVALIIGFAIGGIPNAILSFALCLLWYWVSFDTVLGKLIHKDWFYIGNTAVTDKTLSYVFGKDAGLWKFLICCIVILVINFFL